MCGIVGLLVKKPALREQLGELMLPMLIGMTERGPDSAGLAVFTAPVADGRRKFSLYSGARNFDWIAFEHAARQALGDDSEVSIQANHGVLETAAPPPQVTAWVRTAYPRLHVLSAGQFIDLYKDIGAPAEVATRYDFRNLTGTHLVGHTRMATESAVTPDRAHPFTAGEDWCLVHNGSLSNPYQIRRKLEPLGIAFETDNDTEAACRYFEWRMREGDDLQTAIHKGFEELDGFYTFLMGTKNELALVRDAFACKPAVVAETDDYVAISSEFRSLAKLPDVKNARIFEPVPEEVYVWRA
ncbi:MAG TPA: glutamine amidotransferase family protein [Burkholderiales bacterium]|jgi:amidophosphoribosyltransferase|nr:glutamine amidotransferase family protein [Burkholderiales bacterium]